MVPLPWIRERVVLLSAVLVTAVVCVAGYKVQLDDREIASAERVEAEHVGLSGDVLQWAADLAWQGDDAAHERQHELRARMATLAPSLVPAFDSLATAAHELQAHDRARGSAAPSLQARQPAATPDAARLDLVARLQQDSRRLVAGLQAPARSAGAAVTSQVHTNSSLFAVLSVISLLAVWTAHLVDLRTRHRAATLAARHFHRSTHDSLTGLPNRDLFYDRLSTAVSYARRRRERLAVLFLDLDGFKSVNDEHGHQIGDATLKEVARRLRALLRDTDTVARLGGDEFAVVVGGVATRQDTERIARKIIAAVGQPMPLYGGRQYAIGVSIGIATYPDHGCEIDSLIKAADGAMYDSKHAGPNQFRHPAGDADLSTGRGGWLSFVDVFRLGVTDVDDQHEQICEQLDRLNVAVSQQEAPKVLLQQLDELVALVAHHFATEEEHMTATGYPQLAEHVREHLALVDEIKHLRQRFTEGGELMVLQWLKDWLIGHVTGPDRLMSEYLLRVSAAGASPPEVPPQSRTEPAPA